MKFHNIAEDILSSKIKIAVLRFLLCYPSKRFSGRELARMLSLSPSSVIEALNLFTRYGLTHKTRLGKTAEWVINKQHLLASLLSSLLKLEEGALNMLRQKIKSAFIKNKSVRKVALFGSVVKGKEKPESDIDLFILVKNSKNKQTALSIANKLNEAFISLFGNTVSPIIYSLNEFRNKKHLALAKHINQEGIIIIDNV